MLTTIKPTVSEVRSLAVAREVMRIRFGDRSFSLFAAYPGRTSQVKRRTNFVFTGDGGEEYTICVRLGDMGSSRWDALVVLFDPEWKSRGRFHIAKCVGEEKGGSPQVSLGVFFPVPLGGMYDKEVPDHLNGDL